MTKVLLKSFKIIKIPSKPKKNQICSKTNKNYQNTHRNLKKITKIAPPKPKNLLKYPINLKLDQNTSET